MKERPIIFSTELIPKILDGSKTQTRRVIKPQPLEYLPEYDQQGMFMCTYETDRGPGTFKLLFTACPYGQVGDRLWVRETFLVESEVTEEPIGRPFKHDYDWGLLIPHYKATDADPELVDDDDRKVGWGSPLYMPRWASRITLEITGIRVERLQEITSEDVLAEGLPPAGEITLHPHVTGKPPIHAFANLWDSINAKRGYPWESNPWVWVIEFKVER